MASELWVNKFGDQLVKHDGSKTLTKEALSGKKRIGIYFSGHWCPPCRAFTPELKKMYEKIGGEEFEIVFVSSDRDVSSFTEYFNEMGNWLALPYEEREKKNKLSEEFEVEGIPTFIVLNEHGKKTKGNEMSVTKKINESEDIEKIENLFPDYTGDFYLDTFGEWKLQSKEGMAFSPKEHLKKFKRFVIYYSAHWCPPCRSFTPKLKEFYNRLREDDPSGLEVIFCSGDNSEEEFKQYYETMPWISVRYVDAELNKELNEMFDVEGIPHLEAFDGSGKSCIGDLRSAVMSWSEDTTKPIGDIASILKLPTGNLYADFLPQTLLKSKEEKIENAMAHLQKFKRVGFYFSASWCPPCHDFTPLLIKFYNSYKEKDDQSLEIVFSSFDRDEQQFNDYFETMPWLALEFGKKDLAGALKIQAIPTLLMRAGDGTELKTKMNVCEIVEECTSDEVVNCDKPIEDLFP